LKNIIINKIAMKSMAAIATYIHQLSIKFYINFLWFTIPIMVFGSILEFIGTTWTGGSVGWSIFKLFDKEDSILGHNNRVLRFSLSVAFKGKW
jgi:hypothetical protein